MLWVVGVTFWSRFTPGERTPGTHWIWGWVRLRACLDTEARGNICCLCRGSNPFRPAVQSVLTKLPRLLHFSECLPVGYSKVALSKQSYLRKRKHSESLRLSFSYSLSQCIDYISRGRLQLFLSSGKEQSNWMVEVNIRIYLTSIQMEMRTKCMDMSDWFQNANSS